MDLNTTLPHAPSVEQSYPGDAQSEPRQDDTTKTTTN